KLFFERRVIHDLQILILQFLHIGIQHFGDVSPTKWTVISFAIYLIFTHFIIEIACVNECMFFNAGSISNFEFKSKPYSLLSSKLAASSILSNEMPPLNQ